MTRALIATLAASETDGLKQVSPGTMAAMQRAVFADGCAFVADAEPVSELATAPTAADCTVFDSGLVATGLQNALTQYLTLAADLLDDRECATVPLGDPVASGTRAVRPSAAFDKSVPFNASLYANVTTVPYSIPSALHSPDMLLLHELDQRYLLPAFIAIEDAYHETVVTLADRYALFLLIFLIVTIVGVTAVIAGWFLPAIWALDGDLHHKRALLLLLPPQALTYVPALKAFVESVMAGGAAGGGGARASSWRGSGASGRNSGRHDADVAGAPAGSPADAVANPVAV